MAKNSTIFNLLQNFLSEEELQSILTECNFTDTARKCTVSTLISYLVGAASHAWKSMRHAADVAPSMGLVSVDHSSLSKRLTALDYHIMKRILAVIIGKCNRSTKRTLSMKKELMAVDFVYLGLCITANVQVSNFISVSQMKQRCHFKFSKQLV